MIIITIPHLCQYLEFKETEGLADLHSEFEAGGLLYPRCSLGSDLILASAITWPRFITP